MATAFKQVADNASSTTATDLSSTGVISIVVKNGDGAKFPQPGNGFIVTLWNNELYGNNPALDPNMEKVTCTARATDTLTISATTKTHTGNVMIALLDVAQNTTDLQTAVNAAETNIATNTAAITAETSRATTAEATKVAKAGDTMTGNLGFPTATKTANYTMGATDRTILCDATSGTFTVTLPDATTCTGKSYTVSKIDSTNNFIYLLTQSAQVIDAYSEMYINAQSQAVSVLSDGTNWRLLS